MPSTTRKLRLTLALTALVLSSACSEVDPTRDSCSDNLWFNEAVIRLQFAGFDEHVGELFKVRTIVSASEYSRVEVPAVPAPAFTVDITGVCSVLNEIEFYADVNGNGHYDHPPVDHAWRLSHEPRRELTVIDVSHDMSQAHLRILD